MVTSYLVRGIVMASLLLLLVAGCAPPAPTPTVVSPAEEAAKEAQFYQGKTITFIVPYATGGGYDAWARLIAPYLSKHTGATVVVNNMPGAGGLTATNKLYATEPNGLTIGIINGPGTLQNQLTGAAGVQYDLLKFTYIGRVTTDDRVLAVGPKGKYKTIEAMRQATDKVKLGAPGVGSDIFVESAYLAEILGFKLDLIAGYDTSEEVDLAVVRGELDGAAGSYASKVAMIRSGDLIPILQYGKRKIADLPNVPSLEDLTGISEEGKKIIKTLLALREIGRPIVAPPGVPAARAAFLEQALKKALDEPELKELAKKQKMEVIYMSAAELRQTVKDGLDLPPEQIKRLQDILAKYRPSK